MIGWWDIKFDNKFKFFVIANPRIYHSSGQIGWDTDTRVNLKKKKQKRGSDARFNYMNKSIAPINLSSISLRSDALIDAF